MYQLKKCNLCKGKSLFTLYSQSISHNKPWSDFIEKRNFPLLIEGKLCRSCGWIFKDTVFNSDELNQLYNFEDERVSLEAELLADKNSKYRGGRIFQTVAPWLASAGTVLDVGGRNGELMETFLEKGFGVSVLDMDAGSPIASQMLKIRSPFLDWKTDTYDLITMSHVLEHTESPGEFLIHARTLLKEGGLIFVEVPSELITCLIKRHVGDHRHLSYFTRQTLRAHIKSSGFDCLSCELLIDVVGSKIPLLRAVARKSQDDSIIGPLRPSKGAFLRSVLEVFHPLPWLSRLFKDRSLKSIGTPKT